MSVVVDGIGLVGTILGIWSFITDNIPAGAEQKSVFRVQVGVDGTQGLTNAGGDISLIKVYNSNNNLIGSGSGGYVTNGGFADFTAQQSNLQQALATELYAGNDATCIAYISATMADGGTWGFIGDWGFNCDLDWYHSGYRMKSSGGDDDTVESPRCVWIDGDHSEEIKAGVIAIEWANFRKQEGDPDPSGNGRDKCGSAFRAYPNDGGPQILSPGGIIGRVADPSGAQKSRRSDDRLVVSSLPGQRASDLCESVTSWGPDFVSLSEGTYCNMETHEVLPLCQEGQSMDCFDLDGVEGPATVSRAGMRSPKNATRVVEWN